MTHLLFTVVFVLLASPAWADHDKLDLLLQPLVEDHEEAKVFLGKSIAADSVGAVRESPLRINVLIKSLDPELTAADIIGAGGQANIITDEIVTASVPTTFLAELETHDEVLYIEASKRLTSKLDTSRLHVNADDAQDGTAVGTALTGQDVIVGVVDESIDYGHDDFKGSDDTTRVQFVRQRQSSGTFRVCVKSEIDAGTCASSKISDGGSGAHGTHVTGIAASANTTYRGMAPGADIFFVFSSAATAETDDEDDVTTFSGAVLDGVTQIFLGADALDKPAVVNLSLGTSLGAHDGTSILEQGLDELIGSNAGRIVVNAAGNENVNVLEVPGAGGIHADINVSSSQATGWRFGVISTSVSSFGGALVDIWLNQGDDCTVEARAYLTSAASTTASARANVGPVSVTSDSSSSSNTDDDGTVNLALGVDSSDTNNSRPHALVTLTKQSSASWTTIVTDFEDGGGYVFDVIIRATSGTCTGSMWLYPDYTTINDFLNNIDGNVVSGTGAYTLADGDSNKTTTIPATATKVIAVGSYMQEKPIGSGGSTWTDVNGTSHDQTDFDAGGTGGTVNAVSNFSSLGPTGEVSGSRTKPDIVAPGEPIISTLAGSASVLSSSKADATHVELEGTSMSSPHAAGAIALLLQYNNTLTAAQVKTLLQNSATSISGATSNAQGSGKINIAAALQQTSADTSAYSGTADLTDDDVGDEGFATTSSSSSSGWGCNNA
ncbi:MAG: S8 family serine peptidase, partial [Deltaproteobacteria bacterium]|nr:S8 family serine peptidase [Deltaproteobacteria bacterium]